ncbi:MAG TPA: hypothetical protein PLQ97_11760 [Myxococcota bacterium]|nr:hypothetical protein [Myxococcota bacterium]HQK51435.1 hypothetical protein [Myxococcota bacterium]
MTDDIPPIEDLLPHRGPMRLIDRVVAWEPDRVACRAVVRPDNPFLRDGRLEAVAHMELIAQAAAAHITLADPLRRPIRGYLVAARDLVLAREAEVLLGTTLEVFVQEVARLGAFASYEGRVTLGDQVMAQGNVKVYRREDEP